MAEPAVNDSVVVPGAAQAKLAGRLAVDTGGIAIIKRGPLDTGPPFAATQHEATPKY
jgi:hypothetical protein